MARFIELVLTSGEVGSRKVHLFYELVSHPIGQRYFRAVEECIENRWSLKDQDRFYNFPGCPRDRAWIADQLNHKIAIINAFAENTIPERAHTQLEQPQLNHLHTYFERLRGAILKPGQFYSAAPESVQVALEDFNLLIHRYEDCARNEVLRQRGYQVAPYAVLSFENCRQRYPLEEEDYRHFHTRSVFGELLLSYCELGKPLLDVYQDRDQVIGDDNIRPLRYYSGDALLRFGGTERKRNVVKRQLRFIQWWLLEDQQRMARLGFKLLDPRNAIGDITVGRLRRDRGSIVGLSPAEIVQLIGKHSWFDQVLCHR